MMIKDKRIKNYPYHIGCFSELWALDRKILGASISDKADPIHVTLRSTIY